MIDKILYGLGQVIAFFDEMTGSYVVAMLAFALITEIALLPFGIKQQKNSIKQALSLLKSVMQDDLSSLTKIAPMVLIVQVKILLTFWHVGHRLQ